MHEIVLYKKRNFTSVGIFVEAVTPNIKVLNEEGKTIEIDKENLFYNSKIESKYFPNINESKLELRELRKQLEEQRNLIDLETIWECSYDPQNNKTITLRDIINLHPEHKNDYHWLLLLIWSIERDDIYFKKQNYCYIPNDPDEIEKTIKRKNQEQIIVRNRNRARDWVRQIVSGEVEPGNDEADLHSEYISLIRGYAIKGDDFDNLKEAKSFITESGLKDEFGALEFLINIGLWNRNDDPVFTKYGIKNIYPSKVLNETESLLNKEISYDRTIDISKLAIYSVDDENTSDIDDALSIETLGDTYRIGIHITNVAGLIDSDTSLDKEALKRGETIYVPDGNIHMFPPELAGNLLSLKENKIRKAISLFATFDANNNLQHYEFLQTRIKVNNNINYEYANELIETSPEWKRLVEITTNLKNERIKNGAVILQLPTLKITIEDSGNINIIWNSMSTPAHNIVAELMILINRLSAHYFRSNNIPALYRTQIDSISDDIHTLDPNSKLFPIEVIKYLKPTSITNIPASHRFLGVSEYVQISSPIRRYLDLVMQRQLLRSLDSKKPFYTGRELDSINTKTEMAVREKKLIEKTRERYWILRYLKDNNITAITGIISSVRNKRASAYFPEFLMEIPFSITSEEQMNYGNEIEFNIESIDLIRKRITIKPK